MESDVLNATLVENEDFDMFYDSSVGVDIDNNSCIQNDQFNPSTLQFRKMLTIDSKSEKSYYQSNSIFGLPNLGNSCYINAVIQLIYPLVNDISSFFHFIHAKSKIQNIVNAINTIYDHEWNYQISCRRTRRPT